MNQTTQPRWMVQTANGWQPVWSDQELQDWIAKGWARAETMVQGAGWAGPMPLGRVEGFAHLFVRAVPPSGGGGLGAAWGILWGFGQLVVFLVALVVGAAVPAIYAGTIVLGMVFLAAFVYGRFRSAPDVVRGHPVLIGAWAATLCGGGFLGWMLHHSRVEDQAKREEAAKEVQAENDRECSKYLSEFLAMADGGANEALPYDEGIKKLDSWATDADNGHRACLAAGRTGDARALEAARQEVLRQKQQAMAAAGVGSNSLDPASCPKGRVMIDAKTGTTINCTGPATAGASSGTGGCPSMAQYNSIQTGMTRAQVVSTLGPGEQMVQQNIAGMTGEILQWKCTGLFSVGVLIVQFQNGQVVQKSQQGLR